MGDDGDGDSGGDGDGDSRGEGVDGGIRGGGGACSDRWGSRDSDGVGDGGW